MGKGFPKLGLQDNAIPAGRSKPQRSHSTSPPFHLQHLQRADLGLQPPAPQEDISSLTQLETALGRELGFEN